MVQSGVFFINEQKGWMGSEYMTVDGDEHWIEYASGIEYLTNYQFVNDNTGYGLECVEGYLYKTSTGGVLTSIQPTLKQVGYMTFFSNYPNPFNPSTMINYQLTMNNNVVLEIYNTLGQKVATLVNGWQNAGEHSIQWQVEGMPAGIYLAGLISGDEIRTLKLMLQK